MIDCLTDTHAPAKAPRRRMPARFSAGYVCALAFMLLGASFAVEAQAPAKIWRVAVLTGAVPRSGEPPNALEQRLAELGYIQGRNLVVDFRTAGGQLDRLPALAAELVGRRPDVLVAVSTPGLLPRADQVIE
jgi:ABC-type uncharacterized transport system substrate-binding protein